MEDFLCFPGLGGARGAGDAGSHGGPRRDGRAAGRGDLHGEIHTGGAGGGVHSGPGEAAAGMDPMPQLQNITASVEGELGDVSTVTMLLLWLSWTHAVRLFKIGPVLQSDATAALEQIFNVVLWGDTPLSSLRSGSPLTGSDYILTLWRGSLQRNTTFFITF